MQGKEIRKCSACKKDYVVDDFDFLKDNKHRKKVCRYCTPSELTHIPIGRHNETVTGLNDEHFKKEEEYKKTITRLKEEVTLLRHQLLIQKEEQKATEVKYESLGVVSHEH